VLLRLDPTLAEPLYAQLARQIREAISSGDVTVGERLPTVRDLSESLGINLHTVRQAYGTVEAEGLIESRRGRGVTVIAVVVDPLEQLARQLVTQARSRSLSDNDIRRLLEVAL
jgi:GntR family transcriptional regulator